MSKELRGKKAASEILKEVKRKAEAMEKKPMLAAVIAGADEASKVYIENKSKACEKTGIRTKTLDFPENVTEAELLKEIERLNNDKEVNGILIQLPLPKHINQLNILKAVAPEKDVDGFNPVNVGLLSIGANPMPPCTPAGIVRLLKYAGVEIASKNCVVIGRSNIVGKPAAALMLKENATVTIAHSKTADLAKITKTADILIAAVGIPKFVKGDMVKPGACIVDVGIHQTDSGLCGDVDYESCFDVCGLITPVPGGIGPMTNAVLMENCIAAYEAQNGI